MSKNILQLRRDRAATRAKVEHMLDLAEQERRDLSADEQRNYEAWTTEMESLATQIAEEQTRAAAQPKSGLPQPEADAGDIGMSRKELRQYSLVRAIRASAAARQGDNRAWDSARLELEASQAVAERLGVEAKGFYVPMDVLETRDLNAQVGSEGGYLVGTNVLASSMIELLRNRMVVQQAGAQVLRGLVGNVAIPKQTGGATAYWVAPGNSPTETKPAVGQVTMTPRTLGAYTDYTRQLMLQSSVDVESFVRNDLTAVMARAIDKAALHGLGSAGEPLGIANTTGIGAPGNGSLDLEFVVDLETEVAADNADVGTLAYVTNATVRGSMKQTDIGTDTGIMIWNMNSNTPVNGYQAYVTNQVTGTHVFFGNWTDLIVGYWSGLDILVDPYTHSTSGTMRVVALQDVDVAVRHPQSFALDSI